MKKMGKKGLLKQAMGSMFGKGASEEDLAKQVLVLPDAPRWAAERPAHAVIKYTEDGRVTVETGIDPLAPWAFDDLPCPE